MTNVNFLRMLLELTVHHWHSSEDERKEIRRLGYGELGGAGLNTGLLIEMESRLDILSGVVLAITNDDTFPIEHADEVSRVRILDDANVKVWVALNASRFREYTSYLVSMDALCRHLNRMYISTGEK